VTNIGKEEKAEEEEELGEEEEQEGELVELTDKLEHEFEEPTLPRLTEGDVAFDMEEVFHIDVYGDIEAPSEEEEEGEGDKSEFDL
jgi:hypothetical protein